MEAVRILQVMRAQASDEAVCVFFCRSPASGQADGIGAFDGWAPDFFTDDLIIRYNKTMTQTVI